MMANEKSCGSVLLVGQKKQFEDDTLLLTFYTLNNYPVNLEDNWYINHYNT